MSGAWRFHGTRLSPNLIFSIEAELAWCGGEGDLKWPGLQVNGALQRPWG